MEDHEIREIASQLSKPNGELGQKVAEVMHSTNMFMTRSAIDALDLKEGDTVLELGHGSCAHLPEILNTASGIQYFGLEISELMHDQAKKASATFGLEKQCDFRLYDGLKLPYADSVIQKIMTVNTIYFWKQPLDLLNELYRVLAPEGLLAISFGQESYMASLPFTAYGFTLYNSEKIEALAAQTAFTIHSSESFHETVESKIGGLMDREFTVLTLKKS